MLFWKDIFEILAKTLYKIFNSVYVPYHLTIYTIGEVMQGKLFSGMCVSQ